MTNKEKYPNTDDALKAFQDHKEKCKCDCTFEKWLDTDEEKDKKEIKEMLKAALPMGIAAGFLGSILSDLKSKDKDIKPKDEEAKADSPDNNCYATIHIDTTEIEIDESKFKELIAELRKKNKKA